MDALMSFKMRVRRTPSGRIIRTAPSLLTSGLDYVWLTDFPVAKQNSKRKEKKTKITLEFELSEREIAEFKQEIKSNLNGTLPITVALDETSQDIIIAKQGRGGTTLTRKANRIAEFVSRRISFEYIPAIRTADSATRVISGLVARELKQIENASEFQEAMAKIETLQKPILDDLANSIQTTVSAFLPSVRLVRLQQSRDYRHRALRREVAIHIDDGSETALERKGDGVQSLVALALMRHVAEQRNSDGFSVIAIEEPESHLHPGAVHELKKVIADLAKDNQIVLSSHSPIFVAPSVIESTIIVQKNEAEPARQIADVRTALGVRFSDNLQSARVIGIVEGEDDKIALGAILPQIEPPLQKYLDEGDLVFDELKGATNLTYKVRLLQGLACDFQCFLDNDAAGKKAVKAGEKAGAISARDYTLAAVSGLRESELEDLYDVAKYKSAFKQCFDVDPSIRTPKTRGKKWSAAMAARFNICGKLWSDEQEASVKRWLAQDAARQGLKIVHRDRVRVLRLYAKAMLAKLTGQP